VFEREFRPKSIDLIRLDGWTRREHPLGFRPISEKLWPEKERKRNTVLQTHGRIQRKITIENRRNRKKKQGRVPYYMIFTTISL
jgi:hypothetical protein